MIIKVLGFLDLISALWLILVQLGFAPLGATTMLSAYLVLKTFLFKRDWASYVDMLVGAYMTIAVLTGIKHVIITTVFFIWLLQKAVLSLK